jgi:hypothetical protein
VRDRSVAPTSLRRLDMIAASEIRAAIAIKGGLSDGECPSAVASLLGLKKTTAELRTLV